MSDSASNSEDEMLRRAAAAQQSRAHQPAAKAKRNAPTRATAAPAPAPADDDEDERKGGGGGGGKKKGGKGGKGNASAVGGTQYDQWKNKHARAKAGGGPAGGRGGGNDSGDEAAQSRSRPQGSQKQAQRDAQLAQAASSSSGAPVAAGREPKAARVPIKVERAKATRQADIDSGIAGALRDLAMKKKRKQELKRAKRAAMQAGEEDDDEDDDEEKGSGSEQEEEEDDEDDSEAEEEEEDEDGDEDDALPTAVDDGEDGSAEAADNDEDAVYAYREQHAIHVRSLDESVVTSESLDADPLLAPVTDFESLDAEFGLDARLVAAATGGFTRPSPIQAQCWPVLLGGKDVIGVAHTGSGKTVAFVLPALFYIMQLREREARRAAALGTAPTAGGVEGEVTPRVLILAPTRELAIQICKVAADIAAKLDPDYTPSAASAASSSSSSAASSAAAAAPLPPSTSVALNTPIHTYVVFGGTSIEIQISSLRSLTSLDLLVSTPGRLLKHIAAKSVSLARVGFLVLDEADRMLDLGFEEALQQIDAAVPANRQTALFSATWEAEAQRSAGTFLKRGAASVVKVVIGSEELATAKSVTQVVEVIDRRQARREKRLLQLLDLYHSSRTNRVLIFVLYKKEASILADYLNRKGWKAGAISGDRSQTQRLAALDSFRSGATPILVATDVAARGLDVKDVTHVINFSLGLSVEQYIHRVGRCGRAGAKGLAHTFVVDYDAPHTPALVALLEDSRQEVAPQLREMADRAARQAAKHAGSLGTDLKGDAYYAGRVAAQASKNVNLARELAKRAEEDEIEARIFGDDDTEGVIQKGKKQHSSQTQRNRAGGQKKGGGGGGGGKGRR